MMLQRRFSDQQLEQIINEASIYMCACPGQLAVQLRTLRELHRYQGNCEITSGNNVTTHQIIAAATAQAYALMEDCLEQVLSLEGWDRETLTMPEGLRRKLLESIERDE